MITETFFLTNNINNNHLNLLPQIEELIRNFKMFE